MPWHNLLTSFPNYFDSTAWSRSQPLPIRNAVYVGQCIGSLSAAVLSCVESVVDIQNYGTLAVTLAFRIGLSTHRQASMVGNFPDNRWAAFIAGMTEGDAQRSIFAFCAANVGLCLIVATTEANFISRMLSLATNRISAQSHTMASQSVLLPQCWIDSSRRFLRSIKQSAKPPSTAHIIPRKHIPPRTLTSS